MTCGAADDVGRVLLRRIDFHAVSHIKDTVHLLQRGTAQFMNEFEERRNIKEVVFDHVKLVHEVEDLRLRAAAAMHDTVN